MIKNSWRENSETIQQANKSNKKISYECVLCFEKTNAPQNTKRAEQKLCRSCFGKKNDNRKNVLNDLSGSEWAILSKSVECYNGVRSKKQRLHGAAFPLSLVESQINIYTKKNDFVLDPFAGVGTTIQAAEKLKRQSVGIEINPQFAKLARLDIKDKRYHKIICDDVRNLKKHISNNSIDFLITSPPYATLLKTVKGNFAYKWREHSGINVVANPQPYSSNKLDFGNLSYLDFMDAIFNVLLDTYDVLKPETYAVWVVKDYRDLKNGAPLVNFHSDIISAGEKAKFVLWDIRIYDQSKFRPLVVLGYPSRNYYLNIGHSYILVFKKRNL